MQTGALKMPTQSLQEGAGYPFGDVKSRSFLIQRQVLSTQLISSAVTVGAQRKRGNHEENNTGIGT